MEKRSLSEKIVRNTIFNIIGHFWGVLVVLVLTPYIIHHVGIERFGIWAIIGVITGYFGLLDFGMGTSFVKYIAEFYTKKDYKKINQVVNAGFIFYSIFTLLIITLALFIIKFLLTFFKIPPHLHNEASFLFLIGVILFGLYNTVSPFAAIQTGLQRMDISNKLEIAISIPMIIGTIYFLESGYGLPGLMINNAIILVIRSAADIAIAYRILPELRFIPFLLNWEMIKRLFRYGIKVHIARVEDVFTFQMAKLLISHFLNVGLVSFYQLGSIIINKARSLPLLSISAVLPATSEIEAKGDRASLYELYSRGTKYLALVGVPLLMFVFFTAPLIMLTWMGEGYEKSILVIQILAPCYFINLLTGAGTSMALGIGKPELQMRAATFQLIANVILSIILVIKIGFIGVVVATLISLSLSSAWFIYMFHRHLRFPLFSFIKKIFVKPAVISIIGGSIIFYLNHYFKNFSFNRLFNLVILLLEAFVFLIFYFFIILRVKYVDEFDRELFRKDRIEKCLRLL